MGVIYWGNMVDIYGGVMWGSNGGHMGKFYQGHMEVISWSYGSQMRVIGTSYGDHMG